MVEKATADYNTVLCVLVKHRQRKAVWGFQCMNQSHIKVVKIICWIFVIEFGCWWQNQLVQLCWITLWLSEKPKRGVWFFGAKKRQLEGRSSLSLVFQSGVLPPPASLTRPTLHIVRPQWRRHSKRGSVRQNWFVMVGSWSKEVAELWRKFCRHVEHAGVFWLWCRNAEECPLMLEWYKLDEAEKYLMHLQRNVEFGRSAKSKNRV